jgi:hypothetical protein
MVTNQNGFEGDQCDGVSDESVMISQNVLKTAINEIGLKMEIRNESEDGDQSE